MSKRLERVRAAAAAKAAATTEYRRALQAARNAGYSAATIGEVAGVTRQAVLKQTTTPKGKP